MDARSEKLIAKSKALLTDVRHALSSNSTHWTSHTPTVRVVISYIESSNVLHYPHRNEEIAWFLHEIQQFAYFESDRGGIPDLTSWCEHGWSTILHSDPYNVAALQGLGDAYLKRSQYLLSRIHAEEADMEEDEREDEGRFQDPVYADARRSLGPAVEYLGRAVDSANQQRRLTGGLLAKRAEASMSLGNVSAPRSARRVFREAVAALQMARSIPNYHLPAHLSQYLRENEYILRT